MSNEYPQHPDLKHIMGNDSLSKHEKIAKLEELLQDQLALRNASEEGMGSDDDKPQLSDIIQALESLGVDVDLDNPNASKYGLRTKKH